MAGIDHTILHFKNGRLYRDDSYFDNENNYVCVPDWINGLQLEKYTIQWGRDADLRSIVDQDNVQQKSTRYPLWDGYT